MIKINMLSDDIRAINKAIADAVNTIRSRSYSERHPELGKMINCPVCSTRHYSSKVCEAKYAAEAAETVRGVYGAAAFSKKRFHPHPNKRGLLLIEKTRELYPQHEPYFAKPEDAMKEARKEASRILTAERKQKSKTKRDQAKKSRKVNRGLI